MALRDTAHAFLLDAGLVCQQEGRWRTTRRWQGAMMRAAQRLKDSGDPGEDPRVPMAAALLELFGERLGDADIAQLIGEMLPLELLAVTARRA